MFQQGTMPKHKTIAKGCPKCEQQVPVACKSCPCGHVFLNPKKNLNPIPISDDFLRRTQRIRREKPNYYDALEYDKQAKRARLHNVDYDEEDKKLNIKTKQMKIRKDEEEEDEYPTVLSPEKQLMCRLVLEELNRKWQLVSWKPT